MPNRRKRAPRKGPQVAHDPVPCRPPILKFRPSAAVCKSEVYLRAVYKPDNSFKEHEMRVGIASDHGGFELKQLLAESLRKSGFDIVDFGAEVLNTTDDYPDYVIPLAKAVAAGDVERGIAVCGSGVGASIAANKIRGARARVGSRWFLGPSRGRG